MMQVRFKISKEMDDILTVLKIQKGNESDKKHLIVVKNVAKKNMEKLRFP
ncbi:MAG: hypothetical protein QXU18_00820 [Thermoplasmatales archaeon]